MGSQNELKITDNFEEMALLGHDFLNMHPELYSEDYFQNLISKFSPFAKDREKLSSVLYASIYSREVYGTSILEFSIYHFAHKTHSERIKYITWDSRFPYMAFLNRSSENHLLDNKFEAYTLLKPFYKREAMLLSGEEDYDAFCSFVKKHPVIFVKPNNLELAEGVHRMDLSQENDLRKAFDALLTEAKNITTLYVNRKIDHRLILEDYIVPSRFIKELNPREISLLRVTTILVKDEVHFFYPCLRLLYGNGIDKCGEDYSCVALIDASSGKVVTNGKNASGDFDTNPISGAEICGMVIPEWNGLLEMLTIAAKMLPKTRYIGWDVTHTDKGWCIIEGNTNGEFFYQMCLDHGVKEEFENLIGFKVPYDFWKNPMFQKKSNA